MQINSVAGKDNHTASEPINGIDAADIERLIPLLAAGDIILDGGNSFFEDMRRRHDLLKSLGINFFGVGISGGKHGAPKRGEQLGANLIQAQRDYFGAHTYRRNDREGTFHHEWRAN